jgi:hypothetical protein
MHSPEAQGFARFGGVLLAVSLILPYFAFSFAGFSGVSFRLWSVDKGAFVLVAAFAIMALAQIRFSTRSTTALIYLIVGGLFTAAIIYKIWISPPGSAPLADTGLGGGTMSIDGKAVDMGSISTRDVLEAMGLKMKPSYGAWVAMLGSAFFTVGAFLEFRSSGNQPAQAEAYNPMQQAQYQPPQYQPQSYEQPTYPAPDVAAPAPAQNFPQDPFAPKVEQPAQQPQAPPAVPGAPPATGAPAPPRPPGS